MEGEAHLLRRSVQTLGAASGRLGDGQLLDRSENSDGSHTKSSDFCSENKLQAIIYRLGPFTVSIHLLHTLLN